MALFAHRPQENIKFAALPGEPLRPENPAERLTDAAPGVDDLGLGTTGVESISIPVEPVTESTDESASPRD